MIDLMTVLVIQILVTTLYLIPGVYLLSSVRRKWIADQQSRVGPRLVGFAGFLQPLADVLVRSTRTHGQSTGSNASRSWFWLMLFGVFFTVFTFPVSGHLPTFESRYSVLASLFGLMLVLAGLSGALRNTDSVDSILKLIGIVPYFITSLIALVLAFSSSGLIFDSYQWREIVQQQSDGLLGAGVIRYPVLLLPLSVFFCSGFVIMKEMRSFTRALHRFTSVERVLGEFAVRVFELVWFSWIALLFLGGYQLPFLVEAFPSDGVFSVLTDLGVLLSKALFVQFVFEFIDSLVPRLDGDQALGFAWRFLTPLAILSLAVSVLYKSFERMVL